MQFGAYFVVFTDLETITFFLQMAKYYFYYSDIYLQSYEDTDNKSTLIRHDE